jgi:hydroxymethylpyrimidine pyrophosphatase-like HAD family hydrolase
MLESANIKVVMATAPQDLLKMADIIAPAAQKFGIIQGLQQAIDQASSQINTQDPIK